MCPWTQKGFPILSMELGKNGLSPEEREELKRAHIQTAIHVDEDARETLAREQHKMNELYEQMKKKRSS